MRRDDRLDDVCDIVYIRKSFYAKKYIVERLFGRMGGFLGSSNNYAWVRSKKCSVES